MTAVAVRVAGLLGKMWQVGRGSDAGTGGAGSSVQRVERRVDWMVGQRVAGQRIAEWFPQTEMPAEVPGETKTVN